jgi:hypothetical protein
VGVGTELVFKVAWTVITAKEIKAADAIRTPDKTTARSASPPPDFLRFLGAERRFFATETLRVSGFSVRSRVAGALGSTAAFAGAFLDAFVFIEAFEGVFVFFNRGNRLLWSIL